MEMNYVMREGVDRLVEDARNDGYHIGYSAGYDTGQHAGYDEGMRCAKGNAFLIGAFTALVCVLVGFVIITGYHWLIH